MRARYITIATPRSNTPPDASLHVRRVFVSAGSWQAVYQTGDRGVPSACKFAQPAMEAALQHKSRRRSGACQCLHMSMSAAGTENPSNRCSTPLQEAPRRRRVDRLVDDGVHHIVQHAQRLHSVTMQCWGWQRFMWHSAKLWHEAALPDFLMHTLYIFSGKVPWPAPWGRHAVITLPGPGCPCLMLPAMECMHGNSAPPANTAKPTL